MADRTNVTADGTDTGARLLFAARNGDVDAWERFVAEVYRDLRVLAHRQLAGRRRDQTLDTTGLVHECYLRMGDRVPHDREHFFRLASRVMRHVIVDHARDRLAQKLGAGEGALRLSEIDEAELAQAREFVDLDEALV